MKTRVVLFVAHAALVALVALVAGCGGEAVGPRVVDVNQEPVALLVLPASAQAQVAATLSAAGSMDVDGSIASASLSFGDGAPDEVVGVPVGGDASALAWTHTWARAGLYDVELAVTDDKGLIGRARMRLSVDPPPDATPPALTSLALSVDGALLADGARVAAGAAVAVDVHATDAEGNLASVDVTVAPGSATSSIALAGADAAGSGSLLLTDAGDVVVSAVAHDRFGNDSAPLSVTLHVISPDEDSDGDGLADVTDPAPLVFNGLTAEIFEIEGDIPEDLLGNQRAETLVDDLADLTPAATFTTDRGYLAVDSSTSSLTSLYAGAPDVSAHFVIRYTGVLTAPPGADHVVVDVAADDVGVVFLGGTAVASADSEYATDFFRFTKVPPTSAPVAIDGQIPLSIVVADGNDAYAWSVRFRFNAGDTTVMNPEAVTQQQFEVAP